MFVYMGACMSASLSRDFSYFRYVVTGGEDDLVTVWSLQDHKIIARGEGHKSWVTMVTFDPYNSKGISIDGRLVCLYNGIKFSALYITHVIHENHYHM